MGPMPARQKAGAWKATKTLRIPAAWASVEPLLQLVHLPFVRGPRGIPTRRRAIVVLPGVQEDESSPREVELVDEPLVGDAELLQVGKRAQQTLDVGVVPHFVIADGREHAPW